MTKNLRGQVYGNVEEGVSEPFKADYILSVVLNLCLEISNGASVDLARAVVNVRSHQERTRTTRETYRNRFESSFGMWGGPGRMETGMYTS